MPIVLKMVGYGVIAINKGEKMKKWTAKLNIKLSLTEDDLLNEMDWNKKLFADIHNPTEKEIRTYFNKAIKDYAGSNDGSELLADASYDLIEETI